MNPTYHINPDLDVPIYRQLSDAIRTVYYWMAELFFSFERAG